MRRLEAWRWTVAAACLLLGLLAVSPASARPKCAVNLASPNAGQTLIAPATITVTGSIVCDPVGGVLITDSAGPSWYVDMTEMTGMRYSFSYSTVLTNLAAGVHHLSAHSTTEVADSGVVTVTVLPVAAGTLSASPNPCHIPAGGTVCTASISWSSNRSQTGIWVTGPDNSNPVQFTGSGGRLSGSQSAAWISSGVSRFHLRESVDAPDLATIDVRGNQPPSINWSTVPTDGSLVITPSTTLIGAYASDPDGSVQKVEFWVDNTRVATATAPPYLITLGSMAEGAHTLRAVAFDNLGNVRWTPTTNITTKNTSILGSVGGMSSDGIITGWACSSYMAQSISVHVYLGGPAGSGTYFGSYPADQASEPAVANACGVVGGSYRFRIALTQAQRIQYAGRAIYVHGISPVGGANLLLDNSGAFTVLAPPPVAITSASIDYDELGRVIALRDSAGHAKLSYAYDANGNVTKTTDALNHATTMTYDALDRMTAATDAAGHVTAYQHDVAGRVVQVTDPRGNATRYTYDGFGQLWQQASPDTGTTTFAYDAHGLLQSMTRANGVQTTYGYDGLYRTTSVSAGGETQSATYDSCTNGIGRLCSTGDATGTTSYGYTPEGRVTGRGFAIDGVGYALGYGYDALGRLASVVYPEGNRANYSYANGRVAGITMTMGGATANAASAVAYRPDGAMASWTSGNGLVNTLGYDGDGRLASIGVPGVQSLAFTYDGADRLTRIANGISTAWTQDFGYDALSRLTSVVSPSGDESYQYDANGNRVGQVVGGVTTASVIEAGSNRLLAFGSTSYGYDANGNTTTVNGVPKYHYNAFNRMDSVAGASFYVNPEGQHLRKAGGAGTYYFALDQGGTLLAEYDGAWGDYVWLNGRLVGVAVGGAVYPIHADQTGRPQAITNASSQAVVWASKNDAFDRNTTYNVWGAFNIGFPGQYWDTESTLWHNGFRDYDYRTGRYVQSDPIGLAGGVNTYAYVDGNPISYVDPLGLQTVGSGVYVGGKARATDPCLNAAMADSIMNLTPVVGTIKAFTEEPNSLDAMSGVTSATSAATEVGTRRADAAANARLQNLERLDRNHGEQTALRASIQANKGLNRFLRGAGRGLGILGLGVEMVKFSQTAKQCWCKANGK